MIMIIKLYKMIKQNKYRNRNKNKNRRRKLY